MTSTCLPSSVRTFPRCSRSLKTRTSPEMTLAHICGNTPKRTISCRHRAECSLVAIVASSFVSFTQCSPTCGRMPLPSLSLWPGRQPCRPRLVGDRRGGGPSSVAPRSRNPPTGHRRDSPISSLLFSHGQPLCAVG